MEEKTNNKEMSATIAKQNEQLARYESRLRDVVTAYKGLLKEKEALEASLSAINSSKKKFSVSQHAEAKTSNVEDCSEKPIDYNVVLKEKKQLELQLATLMNSLATLSAEKSRMEASFQVDKKQLRQEREAKDITIKDLKEKLRNISRQNNTEVENAKSKLIIERHEREKEQNDHGVMIRELQKLLSDERHVKEQLEIQLNDLTAKFNQLQSGNVQTHMERQLKEMNMELEAAKRKMKRFETKSSDSSPILIELQNEISNMKLQHSAAIREEQKRVSLAEDRARALAALHEERVANLEARLAELSSTVGSYDRLRQQDQINIQKLKDQITQLGKTPESPSSVETSNNDFIYEEPCDMQHLIEKILKLKKILILENERLDKPLDVSKLFNTGIDHAQCKAEYNTLMQEYYDFKLKVKSMETVDKMSEVDVLKSHVKTLQEKIKVLNRQIDEIEIEGKEKLEQQTTVLKTERTHWKEVISTMETDYRGRIGQLEQQLQKQRDRSLGLLEDKEQEIKTLKESFQMFLPGNSFIDKGENKSDKTKSYEISQLNNVLQGGLSVGSGESPHMLHYAHELARRDVEITGLRRAKNNIDSALRETVRDKAQLEDHYREQEQILREEIKRLERCQSREGANLEYLKNVVLSFLLSTDSYGKSHMLNAIAAVLKFSPSELEKLNKHYSTRWYGNTTQTVNNK